MRIESDRVRQVIEQRDFSMVFQPVYSLARGTVSDLEALTRFTSALWGPAPWFAAAHTAGLGVELELATARRALEEGDRLPADVCLWVNLSLPALVDPRVQEMLLSHRSSALGVEVTGQGHPRDAVDEHLIDSCRRLQEAGVRLSLDAIGYAHAPRSRVTDWRPDQVKADRTVTETLETVRRDRWRARRMVVAAHRRGTRFVAEGIETPAQLQWWTRLGADAVQGFLLAVPSPLPEALSSSPIGRTVDLCERHLSTAR